MSKFALLGVFLVLVGLCVVCASALGYHRLSRLAERHTTGDQRPGLPED